MSDKAVLGTLTEGELQLILETTPKALAELDEDELIALHTRVRRARNKYVKIYRRGASAKVGDAGGRGKAYAKSTRRRGKAEVFEDALARVSDALAAAARASSEALRAQRLEDAQRGRKSAPSGKKRSGGGRKSTAGDQQADRRPDQTRLAKRQASTRAAGARRQKKRDSR